MKYKEIVTVTGESKLFQLLSSKSGGAIVRSLESQSTKFIPSRNHNFTPLESIEVFTTGENVMLSDIFKAMQENESTHPLPATGADTKAIKTYFKIIFPSLDEERVYQSDMKKMLKWYPQLKAAGLLHFEEEKAEKEEKKEINETKEDKKEEKNTEPEKKTSSSEKKPAIKAKVSEATEKPKSKKGKA